MKQANKIILIAAAAIAVLAVPASSFAKSAVVFAQGSDTRSTSSHMDGTHPMPPPFLRLDQFLTL